jgi:hypothetical protein
MPARSYAQLATGSFAFAVLLLAFSESFAVAVLAFGLLAVGSVALSVAGVMWSDSRYDADPSRRF